MVQYLYSHRKKQRLDLCFIFCLDQSRSFEFFLTIKVIVSPLEHQGECPWSCFSIATSTCLMHAGSISLGPPGSFLLLSEPLPLPYTTTAEPIYTRFALHLFCCIIAESRSLPTLDGDACLKKHFATL